MDEATLSNLGLADVLMIQSKSHVNGNEKDMKGKERKGTRNEKK